MMDKSAAIGFGPSAVLKGAGLSPAVVAKARATSQDFEAMFLNSMFGQMFSNVGEGSFSGGHAAKTWQSMLTDEYAKNIAKSGGVGIASSVFKELLAQQEARAK